MWKFINKTLNRNNKKPIMCLKTDNGVVSDGQEIVEILKNSFESVSNKYVELHSTLNFDASSKYLSSRPSSFFLTPITEIEITDIISKTSIKKSAGIDDITVKVVKLCSNYI